MNEWETCIDEWAERLRVSQKETADAQATIADLHGQIDKLANFIMREVPGEPAKSEGAVECAMRVISVLQQRVAQLEQECARLKGRYERTYGRAANAEQALTILQADHARVLGLVQAAVVRIEQVEGDLHAALNGTRHDPSWIRPIQLSRNERQELYLGCESQLKAIRQSLPAQPAQGGA